jgi:hypothetical protein
VTNTRLCIIYWRIPQQSRSPIASARIYSLVKIISRSARIVNVLQPQGILIIEKRRLLQGDRQISTYWYSIGAKYKVVENFYGLSILGCKNTKNFKKWQKLFFSKLRYFLVQLCGKKFKIGQILQI